jgi:hypothetical protein
MAPAHRVAFLGRPVRSGPQLVAAIRDVVEKKRKHVPAFQYVVRGHWKRQVYGSDRRGRVDTIYGRRCAARGVGGLCRGIGDAVRIGRPPLAIMTPFVHVPAPFQSDCLSPDAPDR